MHKVPPPPPTSTQPILFPFPPSRVTVAFSDLKEMVALLHYNLHALKVGCLCPDGSSLELEATNHTVYFRLVVSEE